MKRGTPDAGCDARLAEGVEWEISRIIIIIEEWDSGVARNLVIFMT
jgi:hypothetical protein